jgi:tRNA(Arg) A34 adenosine deaminase TadA
LISSLILLLPIDTTLGSVILALSPLNQLIGSHENVTSVIRECCRFEIPVGVLIVRKNRMIVPAQNRVAGLRDLTVHAEMLVIKQAAKVIGDQTESNYM